MDKFAQRRSVLNHALEWANKPTSKIKGYFDKEYGMLIKAVQQSDDKIRSIVSGQTYGDAKAPKDAVALKQLLKDARSKFNRREYLVVASLLGRYHKATDEIMKIAQEFKVDFNKVHNKFLFAPLEDRKEKGRDKHIENLRELRQRLGENAYPAYFIKEAGMWDQLHNLFTNRGRALSNWEKNYPKAQEIRKGAEKCLDEAEAFQSSLVAILTELDSARAQHDINLYLEKLSALPPMYKQFDTDFKSYYNMYVKPAMEAHEMFNAPQAVPAVEVPKEQAKEVAKQEVDSVPLSGGKGFEATPPSSYPSSRAPSGAGPSGSFAPAPGSTPSLPFAPTMPSPRWTGTPTTLVPSGNAPYSGPPATVRTGPPSGMISDEYLQNPQIPGPPRLPSNLGPAVSTSPATQDEAAQADDGLAVAAQHKQFYAVLDKLANEDPLVVSAYIRKYAKTIQGKDPVTAIKLFGIAKRLKG